MEQNDIIMVSIIMAIYIGIGIIAYFYGKKRF